MELCGNLLKKVPTNVKERESFKKRETVPAQYFESRVKKHPQES